MSTRAGRVVMSWCALYTLAVPAAERWRRRNEMAAHVVDATEAWGGILGRLRLCRDCALGIVSDLAWCSDVRRQNGMPPLLFEILLGPIGATAVAGIAMTLAFLFSLSDVDPLPSMSAACVAIAAAVTTASLTDRLLQWRKRPRP